MNNGQQILIKYIAPILSIVLVFAITSLIIPIIYLFPLYGTAFLIMYFVYKIENKEDEAIDTNKKGQYEEKPLNCPICNSTRITNILYGLHTVNEELESRIQSGEIILGGCTFNENSPRWCCLNCKYTPNYEINNQEEYDLN